MKGFLYGIALQFKMDIRSKTMLITCYTVPLLFFFFMSGVFISVDPNAASTLIPSMSVFVITMGGLMGLPPSLSEVYGGEIKKVYKANGVPLYLGVLTNFISSFIHLTIVCLIIFAVAPLVFKAALPSNLPLYFCSLSVLILVTLGIGSLLGLLIKTQAKITMVSMIIFLPSVMLSGIMFPASMLPGFMQYAAYLFPASIGYAAMTFFSAWHIPVLLGIFALSAAGVVLLLKRMEKN